MNSDLQNKEDSLKPRLSDEFLETLQESVKTCGWCVDHNESSAFVRWCFELAGKRPPDTCPHDPY